MNNVNKTLYIPLYGKAFVSEKGIILSDKKAEEIWAAEGFSLKGKSKSKWLAYYMGMRSAVFDNWLKEQLMQAEDAVVLHLGCGMDSRALRVTGDISCLENNGCQEMRQGTAHINAWYDVDFPDVIAERKRYYKESEQYHMIASDIRSMEWLAAIPAQKNALVVMEGVSMYLELAELQQVLTNLTRHFEKVNILLDCYTTFAAKASKYKNPINDVGVTKVYGLDEPKLLEGNTGMRFVKEHDMTPEYLINELQGMERSVFKKVYGGGISKKMYRLYEFGSAE